MLSEAVQPEIHGLIESKDFATLKASLQEMEIHDLTALLVELEDEDLAVCFRLLSRDRGATVFAELEVDQQEELIHTLSSEKVSAILNEMAPDDRTELLEELPGQLAQRLLNVLRGDELKVSRTLLAYPQESIGRLMTPEYVAVRPEWTIDQAISHIRKVAPTKETLYVLYVVDSSWKLLDEIRLEDVLLAPPDSKVADLMDEQVGFLTATDDQEDAIEIFKKYDAWALPVVKSQGILVGIVTHDDIMDVAEEEDTEDVHKMVGIEPLQTGYFSTGTFQMIRKRLPWLGLLLAAQTLTTVALIHFQHVPVFAVMLLFMPLINSPAGNTGTQIAGLMIRGLALQDVAMNDWWRVLGRELLRGLTLGVILACIGFIAAVTFARVVDTGDQPATSIASAVSVAIFSAVSIANLLGCMLPFFFKRIGLDPAVTSGPFLASLMDLSGIVIYFTIGLWVLTAVS